MNRCCNRCRCNPCRCQCQAAQYMLSGVVIGTFGEPVENMTVAYTVNGQSGMIQTNNNGGYTIIVPANAGTTIQLEPGLGVTVIPIMYNITNVNGNIAGLDFVLTVVGV